MKVTFEGNSKELSKLLKNILANGNNQDISKDISKISF